MNLRKDDLGAENAALREALWQEWSANHYERCTNDWPHKGYCHCPPPRILKDSLPSWVAKPNSMPFEGDPQK